MEKTLKFNSQIATSRVQSERLLTLGLKKETADMSWFRRSTNANFECCTSSYTEWVEEILPIVDDYTTKDIIPAWSLHRLMEMMPISIRKDGFHNSLVYDFHRDWCAYMLYANGEQMPYNKILKGFQNCNLYDNIIDCIEWLIKEGLLNKEYLEEKK